ncbi:MAG: branched-chain amino acid transaminase [Herpetosiphon sp.]|nr:branched-chain amino acid transaminase [Herpetosiphon sp.]
MAIKPTKYIWMNGEMVAWENATVHVMSHALHYGSSIFEGIRAYNTPNGTAIFRLQPHLRRLYDSAKIYRMEIPYTQAQLTTACQQIVRDNELKSAYLRPLVWRGYGTIGVNPLGSPVETMISAIEWGAYLGEEAIELGVDVCVSSWTRLAPNTMPTMAKAGGNYLSSQLIVMEAVQNGYVEGIALDVNGVLSEGSGENLFVIRDGVIYTTPLTAAILPGITRDSVITLAKEHGYEVREQNLPREALYLADELFFTGTAAEVSPIRSVDGIQIGAGKRGAITTVLQKAFFGLFNGETEDQWGWLEYVE